jgi:hypothetical protein
MLAALLEDGESAAVERLSRTTLEDLCRAMRNTHSPPHQDGDPGSGGAFPRIPV